MDDAKTMVLAMLLGDVRDLDPFDFHLLSRLGLSHLLSVSGFHMALGMGIALGQILLLRRFFSIVDKKTLLIVHTIFIGLAILWMSILADASNWQKPAVRSLVFSALVLASRLLGTKPSKATTVALSLIAAWFLGRGSILSFLLSAAAVGGFFLAQKNIFSISLWAWLSTNTIVVFYFHQISVISCFTNIVFGSLISITVILPAFVGYFFRLLHLEKTSESFFSLAAFAWLAIKPSLVFFASLSFSQLWVSSIKVGVCFLTCILLWQVFGRTKRQVRYSAVAAALLLTHLWPFQSSSAIVLDVGQGDSILLHADKKQPFLVDIGPASKRLPYPARAVQEIESFAIDRLAGILITHPDWDHYGGLKTLVARHAVASIWIPASALAAKKTEQILELAELYMIPISLIEEQTVPFSGLTCLSLPGVPKNSNEISPLCRFVLTSGKSLLLTGDMGKSSEAYWENTNPNFLRADYLKVAHHGSKNSSSSEFLDQVNPKTALISVGARNFYGHPSKEVMGRLEGRKIVTLRTDKAGNIHLD
jgi:competence protein ComEC